MAQALKPMGLNFAFPYVSQYRFHDFPQSLDAPNATAIKQMQALLNGTSTTKQLVLIGHERSLMSLLCRACIDETLQIYTNQEKKILYIDLRTYLFEAEAFSVLWNFDSEIIVINNIQLTIGLPEWEIALSDLITAATLYGSCIILGSNLPLVGKDKGGFMPDLLSRLTEFKRVYLDEYTTIEILRFLQHRCLQQGAILSDETLAYLTNLFLKSHGIGVLDIDKTAYNIANYCTEEGKISSRLTPKFLKENPFLLSFIDFDKNLIKRSNYQEVNTNRFDFTEFFKQFQEEQLQQEPSVHSKKSKSDSKEAIRQRFIASVLTARGYSPEKIANTLGPKEDYHEKVNSITSNHFKQENKFNESAANIQVANNKNRFSISKNKGKVNKPLQQANLLASLFTDTESNHIDQIIEQDYNITTTETSYSTIDTNSQDPNKLLNTTELSEKKPALAISKQLISLLESSQEASNNHFYQISGNGFDSDWLFDSEAEINPLYEQQKAQELKQERRQEQLKRLASLQRLADVQERLLSDSEYLEDLAGRPDLLDEVFGLSKSPQVNLANSRVSIDKVKASIEESKVNVDKLKVTTDELQVGNAKLKHNSFGLNNTNSNTTKKNLALGSTLPKKITKAAQAIKDKKTKVAAKNQSSSKYRLSSIGSKASREHNLFPFPEDKKDINKPEIIVTTRKDLVSTNKQDDLTTKEDSNLSQKPLEYKAAVNFLTLFEIDEE